MGVRGRGLRVVVVVRSPMSQWGRGRGCNFGTRSLSFDRAVGVAATVIDQPRSAGGGLSAGSGRVHGLHGHRSGRSRKRMWTGRQMIL